jgi:hypothetical protein
MKPFFAGLALRIKRGQTGLAGNEITFETEGCARDLKAALNDLGIPCAVVQAGKQFKVRLSALPSVETYPPEATPAEIPSPAPINGAAKAKHEHVETARKLAEEQAQLALSFSPAKGKRKPSKRPERP